MATKNEIQGWIWNAQQKIKNYQKTIDDCDSKIKRLKPVYNQLGEIKSQFKSERSSTEEIFEEKGTWRGEKHTAFCSAGIVLDSTCANYYERLDAAQDAVNTKIGELQAKKLEFLPLIDKLAAQIAQWWTDFANALN